MRKLNLEILTPDGLKHEGEVESLTVRTSEGDVEILAGHADYFAALGTGRARLVLNGEKRYASVSGGFVSVTPEGVRLVATTFEFADEIDIERARAAAQRAEARLKKAADDKSIALAKAKFARATSRINVAELILRR